MPQPVTPATVSGAPKIFPANLSGMATPETKGAADFAELLKGSQNINSVPGGVAKAEGKTVVDGEAETGLPSEITFYSDNENAEPGDGDALFGEDEALVPLGVLSGETGEDAAQMALATSTIAQLAPVDAAAKAGIAAGAAAVSADVQAKITAASATGAGVATLKNENGLPAGTGAEGALDGAADLTPDAVAEKLTEAAAKAAAQANAETPVRPGEAISAAAKVQGDAAKAALTGAPLAAAKTGGDPSAENDAALNGIDEIARKLAPGQQVKVSATETTPTAGTRHEPGDIPAAAVAAGKQAKAAIQDGMAGDTPTMKSAVHAALTDARRGMGEGRLAQSAKGDAQSIVETHFDSDLEAAETGIDSMIEDALSPEALSKEALRKIEAMPQNSAAATVAAALQADAAQAQASSSAPASGTVTVQGGEMRETVATAPANPGFAPARSLAMVNPDWPANLSTMIRAAQELGQNEIEIALQPEKLGKMTIKLDMRDNNVAVSIVTETDAAAKMLNDNQSRLADLMQKAGLDLTQHQASSGENFQGQGGQDGQMAQNSQRGSEQSQILPDDGTAAQSEQTSPDKGIEIIA